MCAVAAGLVLCASGCQSNRARLQDPAAVTTHSNTAETMPDRSRLRRVAQNPPAERDFVSRPAAPTFRLAVFHIQAPHDAGAVRDVWDHLREQFVSGEDQLSLRLNGIRVGLGHAGGWEPIKRAFDAVEGSIVNMPQPVRMPAGFPLALELDTDAADQTLFFVGRDGVLSGDTWSGSRNVLRVTLGEDARHPGRVLARVVPEVRREDPGMRLVQTPGGVWQVPRIESQAFEAAGFETALADGEFLLIGPSRGDLAYGLIGNAFLSREVEGKRYDSYVILRPERDVDESG